MPLNNRQMLTSQNASIKSEAGVSIFANQHRLSASQIVLFSGSLLQQQMSGCFLWDKLILFT